MPVIAPAISSSATTAGFLSFNSNTILIIVLAIAVIALIIMIVKLNTKLNKFLVGVDSKNLDESIAYLREHSKDMDEFRTSLEKYLETVEKRLRRSVQSVQTIRFNPFKGTGSGGNQSFATAFLNEEGDGVVLSSLYSREHVSVFSKSVKGSKAEFDLSAEETEALEKAKTGLKK
ncbi:MAG: hypothetical protein JWO73_566 [Candidatus Taylorbacteria bacterium]|nr:hypothetical protein [Candidatus Taylorbacteria bacterium]